MKFATEEELASAWQQRAQDALSNQVKLIVARKGQGVHEVLDVGVLELREGLVGDRWSQGPRMEVGRQLTLMMYRAAALVCAGQQPLHMPGDNFLVDADLSESTAPVGARFKLGGAQIEISPLPHTGCKKFLQRFGADALAWINAKENASLRLRGVNARVLTRGEVRPGDSLERLKE